MSQKTHFDFSAPMAAGDELKQTFTRNCCPSLGAELPAQGYCRADNEKQISERGSQQ